MYEWCSKGCGGQSPQHVNLVNINLAQIAPMHSALKKEQYNINIFTYKSACILYTF